MTESQQNRPHTQRPRQALPTKVQRPGRIIASIQRPLCLPRGETLTSIQG